MSGPIEFRDPPVRTGDHGSRGRDYPAILRALVARPGEWAVVTTAPSMRRAQSAANRLKAHGAEAVCRTSGPGVVEVFARITSQVTANPPTDRTRE